MPFVATWRDLDIVTLSEVRHGKTNIIRYHLYVESYKKGVQTYLQNRNEVTDKLMFTRG